MSYIMLSCTQCEKKLGKEYDTGFEIHHRVFDEDGNFLYHGKKMSCKFVCSYCSQDADIELLDELEQL
jgi:hypothetical protein